MPPPAPLLAAGLDWLESLLPVLFVAFWVISQIFAAVKRVAGPAERPPVARPGQPPKPDRNAAEIEREIREFLRRGIPDARSASPRAPQPRPPGPKTAVKEPERSKAIRPPPPSVGVRAANGEASSIGDRPSIGEMVKEDFAKELDHLSSPLTADRSLGPSQVEGGSGAAAPTVAGIRKALRSPAALRDLIVVREILERPLERW